MVWGRGAERAQKPVQEVKVGKEVLHGVACHPSGDIVTYGARNVKFFRGRGRGGAVAVCTPSPSRDSFSRFVTVAFVALGFISSIVYILPEALHRGADDK